MRFIHLLNFFFVHKRIRKITHIFVCIGRSGWSVSPVEQSKEKEKSETEYESYPYGMENKAHDNFYTKKEKAFLT